MIKWNSPKFDGNEIKYVTEVLNTGYVSEGPFTKKLEEELKKVVNAKHIIMTTSATAALYLAIEADKRIRNYTDGVVIIPNLTFIATKNAVEMAQLKPEIIDVNGQDYGMQIIYPFENKLFIPVNLLGRKNEWASDREMENEIIIYDNAGCLGSNVPNGKVGCYSLQANKIITSVTPDEYIVVRFENGDVEIRQIGEFVDTVKDFLRWECLSFDKNTNKIGWSRITGIVDHQCEEPVYKIKTRTGREVKVTESHSLFKLEDGKIIEVSGKDLKRGDYVICPQRFEDREKENYNLNLFDYFKKYKPNYTANSTLRGKMSPQKRRYMYLKDMDGTELTKESFIGRKSFQVKPFIEVNKEVARLLGYFAAEGSFGSSGVSLTFCSDEEHLAKECESYFKKYFNCKTFIKTYPDKGVCRVHAGANGLKSIFKDIIRVGHLAIGKKVPTCILSSPKDVQMAFLDAYSIGDGHKTEDKEKGIYDVRCRTISKELAQGIQYLLMRNNIPYTSSETPECERKFGCRISKCKKFYQIRYTFKNTPYNQSIMNSVPLDKIGKVVDKVKSNKKGITKERLKEFIGDNNLSNSDFSFLEVISIEKQDYKGRVYDLSVAGNENFVGGFGWLCLHNSGQGGFCATDDDEYAKVIRQLKDFGREDKYQNNTTGFNFKFNDIQAAVALAQLEKLDERRELHIKQYNLYKEELSEYGKFVEYRIGEDLRDTEVPLWVEFITDKREELYYYLLSKGIECREPWKCLIEDEKKYPNSKFYQDNVLWLPNGSSLTLLEQTEVIKNIKGFFLGLFSQI